MRVSEMLTGVNIYEVILESALIVRQNPKSEFAMKFKTCTGQEDVIRTLREFKASPTGKLYEAGKAKA